MVLILKEGASKQDIEEVEKILYQKKVSGGFNVKKYNGVLKLKMDPMVVQKELRDEWERDFN